jgi:ribosomal protein S27E
VCTSPNHNADKGFQVKVQCANCTFMNGQFALACEMCGRNLGTK